MTLRPNMVSRARRLADSRDGATVVEFALILPTLCVLLMGAFDLGHTLYVRAALQGIVQKAARDSALEDATTVDAQNAIDASVTSQMQRIVNTATLTFTRRYYRTFSTAAMAQAESWTDNNHNGTCDGSEPYEDANNNGVWDADGGNAGQGGAKDSTLYTVTVNYPRVFPVAALIGLSPTVTLTADTVLRNQPYGDQSSYASPTIRNCPAAVVASPTPTPTPSPTYSATPTPTPTGGNSGNGQGNGGGNGTSNEGDGNGNAYGNGNGNGGSCYIAVYGVCVI